MSQPFGYLVVGDVSWEAPEILSAHATLDEARAALISRDRGLATITVFEILELLSLDAVARFTWVEDHVGVWEGRVPRDKRWKMTEVPLGN